MLRDFGIGYAPDDWEALKRHLSERGITEAVQVEYGLLVQREESGRTYDRFRDRVMFPIRDVRGRTIAFGGRVLGDAKPKYLNSPETPVFHKGRELYGLFEARQANPKLERVVIVEGYMDVVALAQFGIRYAVATLGTSTSEEHLLRLFRLVNEVVFCFDGDRAGRQAASRALEAVLPQMIDGREARFLFLPEGDDPDTLVRREGAEAFEDRVTCASPLSEFLFDQASQGRDLSRVEERERFATQVLKAASRLPKGMLQTVLLGELARRTGVDQSRFETLMAQKDAAHAAPLEIESGSGAGVALQGVTDAQGVVGADVSSNGRALGLMARVLQLLVHEPALVEHLPAESDWCPEGEQDGLLCRELIRLLRAGRYRSPQVVLAHFQGSAQGERLAALARREMLIPREARGKELEGLVAYLKDHRQRQSPQEEFEALLTRARGGERLSLEARQRLQELLVELKR